MDQLLGVAPCAWGVWYSEHKSQPSATQYIKDITSLGISWTELGPLGYLAPTSSKLKQLLLKNNLHICGCSLSYPFKLLEDEKKSFLSQVNQTIEIMQDNNVKYFIFMDDSGAYSNDELKNYKNKHWNISVPIMKELQKLLNAIGSQLLIHPHSGSCIESENEIEQLFNSTNGEVHLCFDSGHHAYSGGDVFSFLRKNIEKIKYIHLKNIDLALKQKLELKGLGVEEIFMKGVMCQLQDGDIDIKAFKSLLQELSYKGFIIFEQDRFGFPKDTMLNSAENNLEYWLKI